MYYFILLLLIACQSSLDKEVEESVEQRSLGGKLQEGFEQNQEDSNSIDDKNFAQEQNNYDNKLLRSEEEIKESKKNNEDKQQVHRPKSIGASQKSELATKQQELRQFYIKPKMQAHYRSQKELSPSLAPDEYIVQEGDTLSDICEQMLADPAFWPKLWSLNPYIKNPHFIWPGMRLQFYSGDKLGPPRLNIISQASEQAIGLQVKKDLEDEKKEIIKKEIIKKEIIKKNLSSPIKGSKNKNLADLLKKKVRKIEVVDLASIKHDESFFVTDLGALYETNKTDLIIPGILLAKELTGACEILGGIQGEQIVYEGQHFLCAGTGDLAIGLNYTILRYNKTFNDPLTDDLKGYLYQYVAQSRMVHMLEGGEKMIGAIIESNRAVEVGDILIPYRNMNRTVSFEREDSTWTNMEARVLSFGEPGKNIGGTGDLVFLDKGRQDGVAIGDVSPLQQELGRIIRKELLDLAYSDVLLTGLVRVVDVTDSGSLAYILSSIREVHLGDKVGFISE